jgi:ribosome recycling factor
MSWKQILADGEVPMKKTIEKLKIEFSAIRTGRANPALLDGVRVESYGTMMPVNQLASVSIPDARTIEIRPWDITALANIEKAILKSEIGLTPINDGKAIRLSLPNLTEERRKELIKSVHKISEDFRISIRNERRQIGDKIKKDKTVTEDDRKLAETQLQKITDLYINKVDEHVKLKEKEIIEI